MKVVCQDCGKHIKGDKNDKVISHSFCDTCFKLKKIEVKKYKEKIKNENKI